MAVQAIVTGTIPVVGEGVNETIDFGLTNKKECEKAEEALVAKQKAEEEKRLALKNEREARRAYYALDLAQHGQVFIAPEQEESQENAWQLPEVTKHQLMNLCQAGDMDMIEQVLRSFFDAQMRKWAPSRLEMEQLSFDLRGLMIHLQQMTQGLTLEPVALAVNTLPSLQDPGPPGGDPSHGTVLSSVLFG